jgi:cytochrome c
MTTRTLIVTAALIAASAGTAMAQDVEKGTNSFKKCLPCHSIGPGAQNKVGPVLNGLDGRKAGTFNGYNYSDAMKNSGITWGEAVFKEYIGGPMQKVPGTRMAFAGVRDPKEVEDLWAYLSQFNAEGQKK